MSGELENQVRDRLRIFPPEAPVVVVPVYNAYEDVLECFDSLLKGTPAEVPILALDDASTDERIPQTLTMFAATSRLVYIRKPMNTGFVDTVNLAFTASAPRDVVVINSDVIVPPSWLERLQAAAYHRSTIATATPFTNHGSIVSVPYRNQPVGDLVGGMSVEEVDARIRATSLRLYPILPTAIGHCVYFKRSALDVVGYFDTALAPGYGEEVDFSQRAVLAGFSHVLADDLFVYHKGSRSFESQGGQETRRRIQTAHERLVQERYPWYAGWSARAATETYSPLARAVEQARAALLGYRIAIDATCLGGPVTGTQVLTLELIRALATTPRYMMSLFVVVNDGFDKSTLGVDQQLDGIVTLTDLKKSAQPRFDLVHRPFQIRSMAELALLRRIAQRLVVSQLDLIAYSNPGYAVQPEEWEQYRRLTHLVCRVADAVIFISHDAAQDATHQGIYVEAERAFIIPPGVDHLGRAPAAAVESESRLPRPPFILMLGTNFRHKNRIYALRLFQALLEKYHWGGRLVFAGPNVTCGGSEQEEALLLQNNPELQSSVCYLGAVTEAEKQWLLKNASLVLYPSTCEGFGLVPFEAAVVGTPALTVRAASLGADLGDEAIYLSSFDPENGVDLVWSLISDATVAAKQVAAIQAHMVDLSWNTVAARTLDVYRQILVLPPRLPEELVAPALSSDPRNRVFEGELPDWRRRLALAFYIAFAEGLTPLLHEIRQYIRWLRRSHVS